MHLIMHAIPTQCSESIKIELSPVMRESQGPVTQVTYILKRMNSA